MPQCNTGTIRDKAVINLIDGRNLGYIVDVEFDIFDGSITAILVAGEGKLFGKCEPLLIPWKCIERIGEDTILVRFDVPPSCCPPPEKKKKWF